MIVSSEFSGYLIWSCI